MKLAFNFDLQVANELINRNKEFPIEIVREGAEPEKFWECLGGKKKYDTNGDFLNFTRLFRCTNEKGYFVVSEKTVDFCQVSVLFQFVICRKIFVDVLSFF